jgi:hypothetical protein
MFKITTAHRMMLPFSTSGWGKDRTIPRLSETYAMCRYDDPAKVLGLKSPQGVTAYISKVLNALTKESFETTRDELKEWYSEGYIIVEWADPPKKEKAA